MTDQTQAQAEAESEATREAMENIETAAAASKSTARVDLEFEDGSGLIVFSRGGDPAEVIVTEGSPSEVSI